MGFYVGFRLDFKRILIDSTLILTLFYLAILLFYLKVTLLDRRCGLAQASILRQSKDENVELLA